MAGSESASGARDSASAATGAAAIRKGKRRPTRVLVRSESLPTQTGMSTATSPSAPMREPMTDVDAVNRRASTGR